MASTKTPSITRIAGLFDVLSDATRLQIVFLLAAGERNVTSSRSRQYSRLRFALACGTCYNMKDGT